MHGSDADRLVEAEGSLRVVLLCGDADGEILRELQSELHAKDSDFDLISGVDLDSSQAKEAMKRHLGDALYVICLDGDLDEFSAKHLQETLGATELVPEANIVVLTLRPGRAELQAGVLVKRAGCTSLPGSTRKREQSRAEAIVASARGERQGGRPAPSAAQLAMAEVGSMLDDAPDSKTNSKTDEKVESKPETHPDESAPQQVPDKVSVRERDPSSPLAGVLDSSDGPQVSVEPSKLGASPAPKEPFGWGRRVGGLFGLIGLATVGLGVFWAVAPAQFAALAGQVQAQLGLAPAVASDRVPADEERERAAPVIAKAEVADLTPEELEAKAANEARAQAKAAEAEEARVQAEAAQVERDAIEAALAEGQLLKLGSFVVEPRRSERGSLEDVQSHCEGLEAYGVTGWRVPQLGELISILKKRLVGNNLYWSQTPGNAEASQYLVYDAYNLRIRNIELKFKGAHGVCVRSLEPAAEDPEDPEGPTAEAAVEDAQTETSSSSEETG